MIGVLFLSGCVEYFDISSSVVVLTGDGLAVETADMVFCQSLVTGEHDDTNQNVVYTTCSNQPVMSGVAELPNWEGTYRHGIESLSLYVEGQEEIHEAVLLDSDEDVWCDNVDVDYDEYGTSTHTPFCTSNFEYFFLWQVVIQNYD